MSLTSIMASGFSREVMGNIPFPTDVFQDDNCVVCPRSGNYSIIGIAFDYILRLELLRINPRAKEKKLIGQLALEHFDEIWSSFSEDDKWWFASSYPGLLQDEGGGLMTSQ